MDETLKRNLIDLGLYVVLGVLVFTLARLAISRLDIQTWRVTLFALAAMFLALEGLAKLGWLRKPFSEDGRD